MPYSLSRLLEVGVANENGEDKGPIKMGIAQDAKEEVRSRRREKAKAKKQSQGRIWTYHPTQTAAAELQMGAMPLEEALEVLCEAMQNDVSITMGQKAENASYYLLARDKATSWQEANTVSVWHANLEKAIRTMAYALRYVTIDFPPELPKGTATDDW
jgi:hypothetical protein